MQETVSRVLVVDDDPNIAELLAITLRYEGYEVETVATGRAAIEKVGSSRPQLVILDVMLPDIDGFEVARQLRLKGGPVRILFLSACDTTAHAVRGLALGGDDYVTKPFSLEELVARVRALLRRFPTSEQLGARLVFADLELDEDTREVLRGRTDITLTPTEFRLLRYLMLNPERVLSKSQILENVWKRDPTADANVIETYISYLRRKIDCFGAPLIHTIHGAGYSLRNPVA